VSHIPDKTALVCGYPILEIRRLLKAASGRGILVWELASIMQITDSQARFLARRLEIEGYLKKGEFYARDYLIYENTPKGFRLSVASAMPQIKRETADRMVMALLGRMKMLPRMNYSFTVGEAWVYGSYTTDAERISDIDVAFRLRPKFAERTRQIKYEHERVAVEMQRHHFRTIVEKISFPVWEVFKFLRQRNPYLHFQKFEGTEEIGDFMKVRRIFPRPF